MNQTTTVVFYITLAILFSVAIGVVFKFFDKYKIDHFQAIVFNYLVCVCTGCLTLGDVPFEMSMLQADWLPIMLVLGMLFVGGFNLVSRTVQYYGIAISSVAQRMSLGLSVPFSIWFYNDPYTSMTILGIVLALSSVILINIPAKHERKIVNDECLDDVKVLADSSTEKKRPKWVFLYPITSFLASVFIEIILQYLHVIHEMEPAVESIVLFALAGSFGVIGIVVMRQRLAWRNFLAGIVLGVPNYFSIYFLLRALESWNGSVVYSINNITVVAFSAILGYFFFKERLSPVNALGIVLALIASYLLIK